MWLSRKLIANLFETTPENVIMHIKNIVAEPEIEEAATTKDFLVVQTEGNRAANRGINNIEVPA